ncbi:MAG: tyrosine-type recombinase/integrase [Planctomycetes bacterium]|nr:tyrosine-type recombinase/integrase [Planctomycetota bacterium]
MPRRNIPPYVQVLRRPDRSVIGYRGWAITGEKRVFGETRKDPDEAHADAIRMRKAAATEASWGGSLETRAKEWLQAISVRVTEDTLAFYRGKLANIYATIPKTMPVDRITAAVVREFVRAARDESKLSARTIQHCRRTLNCLFRWMVRRGIVPTNPIGEVDWPSPQDTRPDVFTEPELVSIIARITDPWANALSTFIACSGLRRAEVARMRVVDVDAENRIVWTHGKTRSQPQPYAEDADDAVATLLEHAKDREYVVPGTTDKARREAIAEAFRYWQKKLGEPRWHPHALRHSLVTIMLRKGVPSATVQRAARHASYATTQRYEHLVAEDVRAGLTRLRILPKSDSKQSHG